MPVSDKKREPVSEPIVTGDSVPARLQEFLRRKKASRVFILVDEHTLVHCLPILIGKVPALSEAEVIELESGEQNKNIEVCTQVWRALSELKADRQSLIINLGGGVITDMGGFIAAAFKRGISCVNIPTTLLAMVDASVGGKTGVDLDGLKNEIGFFSEPELVGIYPPFLRTLPPREMQSGFAEVLKHALIADAEQWNELMQIDPDDESSWGKTISRSVAIKEKIVASDPLEKGPRKLLNFGHTIGHAVETYFLERAHSSLLHGEAVAIGMIAESFLSHKSAGLSAAQLNQITERILAHFGPVTIDSMADHRLIELMRHDKKNSKGRINFTLLQSIGHGVIDKNCDAQLIRQSLHYYRESCTFVNTP